MEIEMTRSAEEWNRQTIGTATKENRIMSKSRNPITVLSAIAGCFAVTMAMTFSVAQAAPIGFADEVNADSPHAYYRFNETSGTTAADEAGNHNGTYR
ncbi:MAG: hypothetical protein ACOCWJ_04325, partial [Verrucomicrobiota bacterium]